VTIGGNLTVNGNLFVNGNITTINANNLNIADSMIYLADNNPADILDIGFVSAFTSAVRYQHTGFVRDATDGTWKLFANVVAEPTTTIDFTNATYSNLQIGTLTATAGTAALPAITTTGDTNTGMFFPAADTIAFAEGGIEAMRINSSGNVVIGTSTDRGAKLTIDAGTLGNTAGSQSKYQIFASASLSPNLDFFEITNTRHAAGNGWQGAGTRLQQKVDVTYMGYMQFNGGTSGATNDAGISFGTGTSANAVSISERMRITTTGDVGIGNTAPLHKLSISGNVFASGNLTVAGNVVFSGWSIRETGTKLYFAYNGVNKMSLETNGNLTVTGDVIAFGNIT
jgi:hypothetical protein